MKRQVLKWAGSVTLLVIIITASIPSVVRGASASKLPEAAILDPAVEEHILQATVQITMLHQEFENRQAETRAGASEQNSSLTAITTVSQGIGTLVSYNGEVLLVSHNHWSILTRGVTPDMVQFHDAQGALLLEMDGAALSQLIIFHDGGTLIIRVPDALVAKTLAVTKIGIGDELQPGDVVHIAYHPSNQNDKVMLLAAEIVASDFYNRVPVLYLRSLDGQPIEPGDSGGGVWVNGYLVGNLWMRVREVRQYRWPLNKTVKNNTSYSYAAGLTEELVELVKILLEVKEPPPLQDNNLS